MSDTNEQPVKPVSWVPHRSVVGGNTLGGALAILLVPFVIRFYPASVDHDSITVAFSAVCTFVACYFIPDSPNR
jgi:hypothetical protein